jgi:hypothetical protein
MSKGDIHITVSGGNADFGNVTLGDKNKLQDDRTLFPEIIQEFYKNLDDLHESQGIATEQIDRLKKEVELLSKHKGGNKLDDRLKTLCTNYSWAVSPLKKLISTIMS